jgi:hypothetical protein
MIKAIYNLSRESQLISNILHFPVSCYWFMEVWRFSCKMMMMKIVLMTMTMIMTVHGMKSGNETQI